MSRLLRAVWALTFPAAIIRGLAADPVERLAWLADTATDPTDAELLRYAARALTCAGEPQ